MTPLGHAMASRVARVDALRAKTDEESAHLHATADLAAHRTVDAVYREWDTSLADVERRVLEEGV